MTETDSVIDGYRVVRVLGSGGMGSVYLGRDPDLPRLDALKVLSSGYGNDPEFRARFLREAAVAASLAHPNIVAIYRRGETADGRLWIAMQFVDGTDADAALKAGAMTPQRAVRIVGEVATALDYAHRHNVVHRDVKPANFLLARPHDAAERVLLGDFGIARAIDDVGLTTTNSVLATMAYAAPEVLAGRYFDGRADIYSLGCSLFRLLTGTAPFRPGSGAAAVMMAHLHQPPPRVSERRPGLPSSLDGVIAKAMAKDPAQRFGTAAELADAARTALRDAPPHGVRTALPAEAVDVPVAGDRGQWLAPTPAPAPPAGARRRRRFILAPAAAVTVVAATVAVVVLADRGGQTKSPFPPASSTTTPTVATPKLVAPAQLAGLLLDQRDLASSLNAVLLQSTTSAATLLDSSAAVDDKQCVSAWAPAQSAAYTGSGKVAVQVQTFSDGLAPAQRTTVNEAVLAFPTPDVADNAVADQVGQWQQCANRTITVSEPGSEPTTVKLGAPQGIPGTNHLLSQQPEAEPEQHCQRALSSKNNVVVDLAACSPSIDEPGRTLVRMINGNIPPG